MASWVSNKLVLGTASFGTLYGVANTSVTSAEELSQVINDALDLNIYGFDTAESYSGANEILASNKVPSNLIYSKILELEDSSEKLQDQVRSLIGQFGGDPLRGLSIHRPETLLRDVDRQRRQLEGLFDEGMVSSWGVSVYDPDLLERLLSLYSFDFVQAPVNILDQRFLSHRVLELLEHRGVRLQARSVFLQGVLVNKHKWQNSTFAPFSKGLEGIENFAHRLGLSLFQFALGFVMSHECVSEVVVGVNNLSQFEELVNFELPARIDFSGASVFASEELGLIDPRHWTK